MDTDDDMPEDEFLEMPVQALPGDLSRVWAIRSNLLHDREADELSSELAGDAPARMIFPWTNPHEKRRIEENRRREQLAYEEEMLENEQRTERLLLRIDEEQAKIDERRRQIEDNALRLRDGRRAYSDGDRYRDGEGRVLTGADEAEAARQHEYRPGASTWAEKQEIDRRADENQKLKDKILKDGEGGQGTPEQAAQRLDSYEKEFTEKVQTRQDAMDAAATGANDAQPVTDYGSADYMNAFGDGYQISAVPAFTAAASSVSREAIRKLSDDDSGTQTAEIKQESIRAEGEVGNKKAPFDQGARFKL
jgi:hypothetical protein